MKDNQNRMTYQQKSHYTYPIPVEVDMTKLLEQATNYVKQRAEQQHSQSQNSHAFEKDISRITNYYTELQNKNDKRAKRMGISEEKRAEIEAKSTAIKLEKEKQLQEIYNKCNGQIEVNLDNGILYFIPLQAFTIEIKFRGKQIEE